MFNFRIYIITDLRFFDSAARMVRRIDRVLGHAPPRGAAVCLRENEIDAAALYRLALALRDVTARRCAFLFVNRRVDVALACGADGVHLGARTQGIRDAKKLMPRGLVGYSAHAPGEALEAFEEGADFVTISPVFPSPGKGKPIGLEGLRRTVRRCRGRPVFALGGVEFSNLPDVLREGAWGAAFIRAALISPRPEKMFKTIFQ
jgi:thiamine-phosphate pyrophosphorylase